MFAVDHADVVDPVDGTGVLLGHILALHLIIRDLYSMFKKSCPSLYSEA